MRTLYFDCFAGASGDMLLGAMLDLGLPLDALENGLAGLGLPGCRLALDRVVKRGVSAAKFRVIEEAPPADDAHGRSLGTIEGMIRGGNLPGRAQDRALRAFRRLGEVEAGIHGVPVEKIHFHEVGAVDSIVDITGFFLALEHLNVERVAASPLPAGRGFVECAHGRMPVPAPATAKLLEGVPVIDNGLDGEVLTPTGALLLTESAESFGPMPPMTVERVGYGAGERDAPVPNAVRAFLGAAADAPRTDAPPGSVAVIEANLDDMRPEHLPHVIDLAMRNGAMDAFALPFVGKKGRPGHLLTILSPPERTSEVIRLLFRETPTLGVRHRTTERATAEREWVEVHLPWGSVRVKRARHEGEVVNLAAEYEDCRRVAETSGVPLKEVSAAAEAAARTLTQPD